MRNKTSSLPLRICYLSRVRRNPYVHLLATGVRQADPTISPREIPTLPWRRLLPIPSFDILHLHWAEFQVSYGQVTADQARQNLRSFLRKLRWTRSRGRSIIYTVHNLAQHEGRFAELHNTSNRWLFAHADAIHVHDASTAKILAEQYHRTDNVFIIPHGNYIGAYPNTTTPAEARRQLDIPGEIFVYLFLGQIRPYKGLDLLIEAFSQLDDTQSLLLIVGNNEVSDYGEQIQQHARQHPHIRLIPTFVDDNDLQLYFNAADIVVLPYRRATTSGAAILAYSFAKPLLAPALGPFPGLLSPERGILYEPTGEGLLRALRQARKLDRQQASKAALAYASNLDWTALGSQHIAMYRTALSPH